MRELQRQYDQILLLAKELPALKREAETIGRNWVEANAQLEQVRAEFTQREAAWEAEHATWQQERDEHTQHDIRLQAIEELLTQWRPTPPEATRPSD